MCGILGYQVNPAVVSPMRRLALLTSLSQSMDQRGGDSWGWYAPEIDMLRKGLGELAARPLIRPARCASLMAHTRYATTGRVTRRNAHPFAVGGIVGAHNGIVANHGGLNAAYRRTCAVDSQHLFAHLDEGAPLAELESYGAVEFVRRTEPDRIYLGSFNGGALCIAALADDGGIIWASTESAIERALECAGLYASVYDLDDGVLYCTTAGRLHLTGERLDCRPLPMRGSLAAADEAMADAELAFTLE